MKLGPFNWRHLWYKWAQDQISIEEDPFRWDTEGDKWDWERIGKEHEGSGWPVNRSEWTSVSQVKDKWNTDHFTEKSSLRRKERSWGMPRPPTWRDKMGRVATALGNLSRRPKVLSASDDREAPPDCCRMRLRWRWRFEAFWRAYFLYFENASCWRFEAFLLLCCIVLVGSTLRLECGASPANAFKFSLGTKNVCTAQTFAAKSKVNKKGGSSFGSVQSRDV